MTAMISYVNYGLYHKSKVQLEDFDLSSQH